MFSFDPSDVVEHAESDDGTVRVHYSVEGPNATILTDENTDGIPDFPALVLQTCHDVAAAYATDGFRAPLAEADLELGPLGGSSAFDVYLVDFAGYGDGTFQVDACDANARCAGHIVIENDFSGYGYDSREDAVDILCSHELFHAVQGAYATSLPIWISEGTATWAEHWWRPQNDDFLGLVEFYLARTDASLHAGPTGPGALFPYGTALFFEFLTLRHGVDAVHAYLLALEQDGPRDDGGTTALVAVHEAFNDLLAESFADFALANLATAQLAGSSSVYPFSDRLGGIEAEASGTLVEDEERLFPLAATYYRLDPFDGDLGVALSTNADARLSDVRILVSPVSDDGVDAPIAAFTGDELESCQRVPNSGDQPVWVTVTQPGAGEGSVPVTLCMGPADELGVCGHDCSTPDMPPEEDPSAVDGEGCNCAALPTSPAPLGPLIALLWMGRSRASSRRKTT